MVLARAVGATRALWGGADAVHRDRILTRPDRRGTIAILPAASLLRLALHYGHRAVKKVAPGLHPLRLAPFRRLVMRAVDRQRPEVMQTRHGFRLHVPRGDRSPYVLPLFLHGEYEPEESRLALSLLRPGDVAVDIGANVGYTTCLMARKLSSDPEGHVHAFEPEPRNYDVLCRNLVLNGLKNVSPRLCALGASCEQTQLFLSEENLGDHTLAGFENRRSIPVEQLTFDEYHQTECADGPIRLVKIDTQGSEVDVLRGMRRALKRGAIDSLLVEFWPARLKQAGSGGKEFLEFLEELSLTPVVISQSPSHRCSIEEIVSCLDKLESCEHSAFSLHIRAA